MKLKILCFVDYYIPGFRGGGPIRTIENMVSNLSNDFEFWIVTRDHDLNSIMPYPDILIDEWNVVKNSKVFYARPSSLTFFGIFRLIKCTQYDVLYLNSFFSFSTTIKILIIRYMRLIRPKTIILAPRGEFSVGALALKSTKKKFYFIMMKWINLYKDIFWQASSKHEVEDICRALPHLKASKYIFTAPDLLPIKSKPSIGCSADDKCNSIRRLGSLRLVFISRISPMKNLDYLLRTLNNLSQTIELYIYGPLEDPKYWALFQDLIKNLPPNILVAYCGEVSHENVSNIFSENDLFVFPTRGENFGHVIYEALSVGTSVITSDQTPWVADHHGALQVIPLNQPDAWAEAINKWSVFDEHDFITKRAAAIQYAIDYVSQTESVEQNRNMFKIALSGE